MAGAGLAILLSVQGLMSSIRHVSMASVLIVALKAALMGYGIASSVIVGAGFWLPVVGVELARLMGCSNSFVGTPFIAFATFQFFFIH